MILPNIDTKKTYEAMKKGGWPKPNPEVKSAWDRLKNLDFSADKKDEMAEGATWTKKAGQNPKGGLNAKGRKSLKAAGQNIKPGVKNYSKASPADKKRWISWALRFYSNPKGPMVDKSGNPTRLALMATAWGEPVPKTREEAQAIAAKARKRQKELGDG